MPRSQGRRTFAMVCCLAPLAVAGVAAAQSLAPGVPSAGPSLQVTAADLRQVGSDLQLRMSFSRPIPVAELDAVKGRFFCLVLDRSAASRRRVCVSSNTGGLRVRMSVIDAAGHTHGRATVLKGARVAVGGPLFALQAPASSLRVTLGAPVTWQTLVTWKDGSPCERATGPQPCTQTVPGSGELTLATQGRPLPQFVREGHLNMLATGDSMIESVDRVLKHRLERRSGASVSSDVSESFTLDWVRRADEQAQTLQPDVTAMLIGANDDFPVITPEGGTAACCAAGWIAEYSRRVETMMRSYLRDGRSLVYWMTLPTPRRADLARIYRGLNVAIQSAAARVGDGVSVIDLVPVLTPGDRFQQYVTFRGRTVSARDADGIRLSPAGAAIAATLLIDRLRDAHALPPLLTAVGARVRGAGGQGRR
jgi:lysophospholipase L1-like esterase